MYVSSSTLAPVRVSAHLGIRVAGVVNGFGNFCANVGGFAAATFHVSTVGL